MCHNVCHVFVSEPKYTPSLHFVRPLKGGTHGYPSHKGEHPMTTMIRAVGNSVGRCKSRIFPIDSREALWKFEVKQNFFAPN